jgi:TonB family protein
MLRRIFAFALYGSALVVIFRARALAVTECCPARVGPFHPLDGKESATLFSYDLSAESARSVTGTVLAHTEDGWYAVKFPETPLVQHTYDYQNPYAAFSRLTYESAPLYVRFPRPVTIKGVFVRAARSTGDQVLGWDAAGDVVCSPPAGTEAKPVPGAGALPDRQKLMNPRTDLNALPGADAPIALAAATSSPVSADCAEPAKNAAVMEPGLLDYPDFERRRGASAVVDVEVAINASGALDGAWIFAPSGSKWFNEAALRAARTSTYAGGTAYCQPANAIYIFQAVFTP